MQLLLQTTRSRF